MNGQGKTITGVIADLLRAEGHPMTADEISRAVIDRRLYTFASTKPHSIIRQQLRRATVGLELGVGQRTKRFVLTADGRYWLSAENER